MINDDTLTLYYYGDDLDAKQRREIEQAMASDEVLAARYATLKQELDTWKPAPAPAAPEHLKHQWHDLVAREAQLERQRNPATPARTSWFRLGMAFASVMAVGIAIGLFLSDRKDPSMPELVMLEPGGEAVTDGGVFARGLQVYLQERQAELVGLEDRSGEEQSALLLQIVAQNRLYQRAAEQQDSPELARLLRAFEPILLQLASEDTSAQDADALRRQLAFELNAMLTKLQQPSSKEASNIQT